MGGVVRGCTGRDRRQWCLVLLSEEVEAGASGGGHGTVVEEGASRRRWSRLWRKERAGRIPHTSLSLQTTVPPPVSSPTPANDGALGAARRMPLPLPLPLPELASSMIIVLLRVLRRTGLWVGPMTSPTSTTVYLDDMPPSSSLASTTCRPPLHLRCERAAVLLRCCLQPRV